MWILRIALGATVVLGFALGGAGGAQAAAMRPQMAGEYGKGVASATKGGGDPLIIRVRNGRRFGAFRAGGFHRGFYRGGLYRGGLYRGGLYRGGLYRGGLYRGGLYRGGLYRGAYVRAAAFGARPWAGRVWRRGYVWPRYGYYGGFGPYWSGAYWGGPYWGGVYDPFWGYGAWPVLTGIGLGLGLAEFDLASSSTSCYQVCRASHGPGYCRRYYPYYCY
jgi:hypothetical protein